MGRRQGQSRRCPPCSPHARSPAQALSTPNLAVLAGRDPSVPGEAPSSYGRHCGEGLLESSLLGDFCVFIDFIFLNSFRSTAKLNREYKRVLTQHPPPKPPTLAPTHAEPPPLSTSSTRVVCLFQLMNLHDATLSSKPIVCIRIRSWCCTFRGFGQMCHDVHPLLYQTG